MKSSLHFIGFKDDRIWNARRLFGEPDFYHRTWDTRARQELIEGDVGVFASGSDLDAPKLISWDDSQQDIFAHGGKELVGL